MVVVRCLICVHGVRRQVVGLSVVIVSFLPKKKNYSSLVVVTIGVITYGIRARFNPAMVDRHAFHCNKPLSIKLALTKKFNLFMWLSRLKDATGVSSVVPWKEV